MLKVSLFSSLCAFSLEEQLTYMPAFQSPESITTIKAWTPAMGWMLLWKWWREGGATLVSILLIFISENLPVECCSQKLLIWVEKMGEISSS